MAKSLQGQTMRKATKLKRIRKFGFMARNMTVGGRNVLRRRRLKKRTSLSASIDFGTKVEKNKKFSRRK